MHANTLFRTAQLIPGLSAIALCASLFACGEEKTTEKVPPVAEIELERGGQLKLEDATPLTDEDIGKVVVATGTVVGTTLPNGFFLRTPGNDVVFVGSDEKVTPGEQLRAIGPLTRAEAATFRGWRVDALEGKIQAEWDVIDTYYIAATSVSKL